VQLCRLHNLESNELSIRKGLEGNAHGPLSRRAACQPGIRRNH